MGIDGLLRLVADGKKATRERLVEYLDAVTKNASDLCEVWRNIANALDKGELLPPPATEGAQPLHRDACLCDAAFGLSQRMIGAEMIQMYETLSRTLGKFLSDRDHLELGMALGLVLHRRSFARAAYDRIVAANALGDYAVVAEERSVLIRKVTDLHESAGKLRAFVTELKTRN
jgi:hypothetical protein